MELAAPLLDAPPLARFGLPSLEVGASPAAGASFSSKIAGNYFARLLTIRCKLVCSATVATRQVVLQYLDDAGNIYYEAGAATGLAASQAGWFVFDAFVATDIFTVGSSAVAPFAPTLLYPTFSWKLLVTNIDATDALTEIRYQWERFFTAGER